MPTTERTATAVLDESFLEVRAKLLEVAAALDRIDRAASDTAPLGPDANPRRQRLDEAIRRLLDEHPDRAETLQKLFSREYEPNWREQMNV